MPITEFRRWKCKLRLRWGGQGVGSPGPYSSILLINSDHPTAAQPAQNDGIAHGIYELTNALPRGETRCALHSARVGRLVGHAVYSFNLEKPVSTTCVLSSI